ncbi:MAG TPA: DUF3618 domain-containing protein [Hyphomonadaceae bacterium]|jgi:ElaB/YqjD/DUF883 family membrane-anchored ribosome-binding protein|nr:DUF3618 domain-containing protein [Hyphomonadaceae bacterium]
MTADTDRIEAEINRSRHALNDTIEQLGGKLSPGQMLDEVMGLAQGQAGQLTANLGKQIRDNPLPLLLIGAGVGMLFLNKGHGHDHQAVHPGMTHDEWKEEQAYRNLEGARSSVSRMVGETQEMFSHRLHQAEAVALDLKQQAGEAVDAFKARVTRTSEGLALKAKDIREKMNAGAAATAQFAKDQAHNLKEGLGDAKHRTQAFYDEYPLAAGAIGVAIGALIGASAPLSSVERENLQGVADAAAKAGADLAEKGARAVDKAANALH